MKRPFYKFLRIRGKSLEQASAAASEMYEDGYRITSSNEYLVIFEDVWPREDPKPKSARVVSIVSEPEADPFAEILPDE